MPEEISTRDLIVSARANATFEPDKDEGGNATLVTLDADLFEVVLTRLHKHAAGA